MKHATGNPGGQHYCFFLLSDSLAFSIAFQDLSLGFLKSGFQFKCPISKGDIKKRERTFLQRQIVIRNGEIVLN